MNRDRRENSDQAGESESDTSSREHPLEKCRPLVRDIDRRFSNLYGGGGLATILAFVGVGILLGNVWGWLAPGTWILAVTAAVLGLFVLRYLVHLYAEVLYEELEAYCDELEAELDMEVRPEELREYFASEETNEYFRSVFEVLERRRANYD